MFFSHFQGKKFKSNICCFQLLVCKEMLLFFVTCYDKRRVFWFWTLKHICNEYVLHLWTKWIII